MTLFSVYSGNIPQKRWKFLSYTIDLLFLRFLLGSEEESSGKFLETANLSCHQIWRKTCLLLQQSGYYLPLPAASLKNILTLQPSTQCPHGGSSCLVYTLKVCNSDRGIDSKKSAFFTSYGHLFMFYCLTMHKVSWLISASSLKSGKKKEVKNQIEKCFLFLLHAWVNLHSYLFRGLYFHFFMEH